MNHHPESAKFPHAVMNGARFTSVGMAAIPRFPGSVCCQEFPDDRLPQALENGDPLYLLSLVCREYSRSPLAV